MAGGPFPWDRTSCYPSYAWNRQKLASTLDSYSWVGIGNWSRFEADRLVLEPAALLGLMGPNLTRLIGLERDHVIISFDKWLSTEDEWLEAQFLLPHNGKRKLEGSRGII
jgi:hypothetical protein